MNEITSKTTRLAAVIPAYKCADQIGRVVDSIPEFVDQVIVVDDASPDAIAKEVAKLSRKSVIYIRHEKNTGVGGAMLTGFQKALELGADVIIKMDGDGQMDAEFILPLITPILRGEADYTKGNRFLNFSELDQMPRSRLLGNIGLTFLTKMASGVWHIFDPNNGFVAIHRHCLSLINYENIHQRYFFESSMLIELSRIRAVVTDVPIPARYGDETSSLTLVNTFFVFPPNLFRGFIRRIIWQYYLYDFTAASLFLILGLLMLVGGIVWGAYYWYVSIVHNMLASTGTVMLAVLPIILGFQLLLQAIVLDIRNKPTVPIQVNQDNYGRLAQSMIQQKVKGLSAINSNECAVMGYKVLNAK